MKIDYQLCEDFTPNAYIVLQAPFVNQDYESIDNPTLTSMFPNGVTATVVWAGNGNTYQTTEVLTPSITVSDTNHQANGKTYSQLAMQVDGNPTFTSGTTITITITNIN